jgi:DMSO/TMAO reductase YedYZ molybdopterin-dependent catalytic subunit
VSRVDEPDIIFMAQVLPPALVMKRPDDADKIRTVKAIGRREFLLTAVSTSSLASSYLKGPLSSLRLGVAPISMAETSTANEAVKRLVTPNIDFFIRNHFRTPTIDEDKWSLEIGGMVANPLKLSYSDILLASSVRQPLTLECAGNVSGGGGVSTAVWSGLSLGTLLKQAGVKAGATTVVMHGADSGEGDGVPAGTHFARAIPMEKAMDPSTILAYEMNGASLPAEHGFPLRALVSGWYGMDSVKWLTRIEVSQEPFKGYFQQERYVALKSNGERQTITRMRVNSKFLRPLDGEEIRRKGYRIEGVAWAGENNISKVELRFDGNGAWQPAELGDSPVAMVWTPWSYAWGVPRTGQYKIEVRATDAEGNSQPVLRDPERKDEYELNTPHRISVNVRS